MFRKKVYFYGQELLSPRPTPTTCRLLATACSI